MATNRVYTESVVTLNNQEATARIEELRKKADELRATMGRLAQEKGINSKEFKAVQKELIATNKATQDLSKGMKEFEKIVNNLNGSSLNELQKAYRTLQQRMRAAKPDSKEFNAYARTLKDVRSRMRELEGQARTTQKMFGGFFSKIGWAGLVAGALSAFKKFASDMVSQTQLVGDKWRAETAGWKSAYGTFIADLSSGRGWNEMIQRMKDAYKNGKQVAAMLDEIFERTNSMELTESKLNLEAEKQRKIMSDVTKTARERLEAAERYDDIQQQIAQTRQDVATQEEVAYKRELQRQTELSDAEMGAFIQDYNNNRELIEQGQEYVKKVQELENAVQAAKSRALSSFDAVSRKAASEQWEQAQSALDEFKASANESVVYWSEIIAKYNLGNDEMVKNYVQAVKKRLDADVNYERSTQRSARQANTLRKQLSEEARQAASKAYQKDVKDSEDRFKEITNQAKQAYADGEISEKEYQARISSIREASLRDRLAIAERHRQATVEIQSQILDLAVSERKKMEDEMKALEENAVKVLQEALDDSRKEIDDFMSEIDQDMDSWLERWTELNARADEIRRELDPVAALMEDMEKENQELEILYENNLLSQEEYEQKKLEIAKRYSKEMLKTQLEPFQKGVEAAQDYLEKGASLMSSIQQAASARLEAQMQAELAAAGDNAEKREEIEAKYEQKQLDLKKKYANVDMTIEIAKTTAAGALAVMKALAELGPISGKIMAAVIAATTAAQIATIVAQRNAIMNASVSSSSGSSSSIGERVATGFSGGGYTGRRANDYQEVGVVHANEWVAPAAMVRANPVMFASLENMRRSGNYRSGVKGFADGGSAGDGSDGGQVAAAAQGPDNGLLKSTHDLLQKLLESLPLPAYVVYSQMNAKQEVIAEIKKIVGTK